MSSELESYSGSGSETLLDEVLATIKGQEDLNRVGGVLEHFWDMFVLDAFIGNNDRNNGNWGLLLDYKTDEMSLAPVFDNGGAFFNKRSLAQMEVRLQDKKSIDEDAFINPLCVFKYTGLDNEGRQINPFKFMESRENDDCNEAVERFLEKVDLPEIEKIISAVPESFGSLQVMPQIQKDFYKELLKVRHEKIAEISCSFASNIL